MQTTRQNCVWRNMMAFKQNSSNKLFYQGNRLEDRIHMILEIKLKFVKVEHRNLIVLDISSRCKGRIMWHVRTY